MLRYGVRFGGGGGGEATDGKSVFYKNHYVKLGYQWCGGEARGFMVVVNSIAITALSASIVSHCEF